MCDMPLIEPLIGPKVRYPTPWQCAEEQGGFQVITCAEGHEAARAADGEVAELIVRLVNREADPGMVDLFEANASLQELAGQLAEARAENERLTRMVGWLARNGVVSGHDSFGAGTCECGRQFADVVVWQWHRFSNRT